MGGHRLWHWQSTRSPEFHAYTMAHDLATSLTPLVVDDPVWKDAECHGVVSDEELCLWAVTPHAHNPPWFNSHSAIKAMWIA